MHGSFFKEFLMTIYILFLLIIEMYTHTHSLLLKCVRSRTHVY